MCTPTLYTHKTSIPSVAQHHLSLPSWSFPTDLDLIELQNQAASLAQDADLKTKEAMQDATGCVEIYVQSFHGIPVRLRVQHDLRQVCRPLPPRFQQALEQALLHSQTLFTTQIRWELYGFRYGTLEEVAEAAIEEINREIDAQELSRRLRKILGYTPSQRFLPFPLQHAKQQALNAQKDWQANTFPAATLSFAPTQQEQDTALTHAALPAKLLA